MSQDHQSTKFNQKIVFYLCRTVTESLEKEKWKPETLCGGQRGLQQPAQHSQALCRAAADPFASKRRKPSPRSYPGQEANGLQSIISAWAASRAASLRGAMRHFRQVGQGTAKMK